MSAIASSAQSGFAKAEEYEKYRPSYPQESIETLLVNLGVSGVHGAKIVDLAAGTGKFTEILAARPEAFEIIAVEPHDDMRRVLEDKKLHGVKVLKGAAGSMEAIQDGWAQALVVAQAFHWFAKMDALREMHRVLEPAGILGLIWNLEDYNSSLDAEPRTRWEGRLKKIIWSKDDNEPRFRHSQWSQIFDEQLKATPATIQAADPLFSLPLGEHVAKWTEWRTKEQVWNRFSTISHISVLRGTEKEDTKALAFEAMNGDDVESNDAGEIAFHGQTYSYWTTAIPSGPL